MIAAGVPKLKARKLYQDAVSNWPDTSFALGLTIDSVNPIKHVPGGKDEENADAEKAAAAGPAGK